MIINRLKRWAIGISLSLASAGGIVYACGDYWDEEAENYYNVLPSSFMDSTFRPFFYNFSNFYYSRYADNQLNYGIDRFTDDIVNDWYTYTQKKMPKSLIFDVINGKDSAEKIAPLFTAFQNGQNTYKGIKIQEDKVAAFLTFFERAHKVDQYSTSSIYSWYDDEPKQKLSAKLLSDVKQYYKEVDKKDGYLINRYWFQVMKAQFYAEDFQGLIQFFEATGYSMSKNMLYYRALGYVAGAYKKLKQTDKANYLYAIIFDRCLPLREVALYNFTPERNADLKAILKHAKNIDEKVAIWTISGYRGLTTMAIDEIYKIKPNAQYLELLVASNIDALQQAVGSTSFKNIAAYNQLKKEKVDRKVYEQTVRIAKAENTSNKGLWYLYASIYAIYADDISNAQAFIQKARQYYQDKAALSQLQILDYMATVHSIQQIEGNESKLAEILTWLDQEQQNYQKLHYFDEKTYEYVNNSKIDGNVYSHPYRFTMQYVAKLYEGKGQKVLEEIFEPSAGYYKNEPALEAMKTYLKTGGVNALEKFGIKKYDYNLDDIYYYQGMLAVYRNDLKKAQQYFKESKISSTTNFLLNPFNAGIQDCTDCDLAKAKNTSITFRAFVDKMIEMQEKINNNDDIYNNALLLGNAFYNISNYGTGRPFYYASNILKEYGAYVTDEHNALLKNSLLPNQYYRLAQQHASLDEQKAKIAYMLAKTERNMYYFNEYDVTGWGYNSKGLPDFKAWNGFKELKQYSHTKFYQQAISDCGYFKTYIYK